MIHPALTSGDAIMTAIHPPIEFGVNFDIASIADIAHFPVARCNLRAVV